jgi:hypothetical protein
MGYSTSFEGVIKFSRDLTAAELREINEILEIDDVAEHAKSIGFIATKEDMFSWLALRLAKDFTGLEWDGSEKTYGMITALNVIMQVIKRKIQDLSFSGRMTAQGEEVGDIWGIEVSDGKAVRTELKKPAMMKCPRCREWFRTEDAEERSE